MVKICEVVDGCEDCPKYGDDCDGDKMAEHTDLISRADAIEAVAQQWLFEASVGNPYVNDDDIGEYRKLAEELFEDVPSADADAYTRITGLVPDARPQMEHDREWIIGCIKHDGFIKTDRFDKANQIILNALSADTVQGEWIPCGEKMPKELERVNVTWLNHNPPFYYQHIKDIPQTDTAVYYRGKWYWWDATVIDVLAEYGEDCNAEQIDKDIEVVAWMPLPKPYREDGEQE